MHPAFDRPSPWRAALLAASLVALSAVVPGGREGVARAASEAPEGVSETGGEAGGDGAAAEWVADEPFVREIAPGDFVHSGRQEDMSAANAGDIANIGFVVGERSVAVIDPGGSLAVARALRDALRARTSLPVSHVILTHFHPDHVFGASVFAGEGADAAEAPLVVAHANLARARVQRGAFYADRYPTLLEGRGAAALVSPSIEVAPGETLAIDLGGRVLRLRAWPTAHTDNDLSVFDVATGTLWAGDLLFASRTPSLDGSLPGWLAALEGLGEPVPERVVPGHGAVGSFEAVAAPERAYLDRLLGETRAAIAGGGRLAEAIDRAERAPAGEWLLFGLQHPTNVTRAWAELEWE